jgi:hypothetical protein
MIMNKIVFLILIALLFITCNSKEKGTRTFKKAKEMASDSTKRYGYNRDFLKKYVHVIELKNKNSALILVPAWQGRVMTSTSEGDKGFSFGWINRDLIASRKLLQHINPFGGEERLWLGPEGGQYSIFFSKGKEFKYENWQTPDFIDTKPYKVSDSTGASVSLSTDVTVVNYSGTVFTLNIERTVTLLSDKEILEMTGIGISGLNCIAYNSKNTISNKGKNEWKKESGLLSVWMLGMFNPSPDVVVVIPVREGEENRLGPKANDNYFGKISPDRLKIAGSHIFFKADGKKRGKIGIPPLRATGVMGSFDSENIILTLLFCKLPEDVKDYVNSAWQIQDNPFSGDALNSYNDGPLEDGSQMGPFYELETSSPAAALAPDESLTHSQITVHLTGARKNLNKVALQVLGVSLEEIENAFK